MNEAKHWKVLTALISAPPGTNYRTIEKELQQLDEDGYEPRWVLPVAPNQFAIIAQPKPVLEMLTSELSDMASAIDERALRYVIERAFNEQNGSAEVLAEALFTRILALHGAGQLLKK